MAFNTLTFTFTGIPENNNSINVRSVLLGTTFNRTITFKTAAANPGEVTIGASIAANQIAFSAGFNTFYGVNDFIAAYSTAVGGALIVTITLPSTSVFNDILTPIIIGSFCTFELTNSVAIFPFISNPYVGNAYTLDNIDFPIESTVPDAFIEIQGVITAYSFFGSVAKTVSFVDKIALRERSSEINYGQRVHRFMQRFSSHNNNYFQYKKATLTLTAIQKLYANNAVSFANAPITIPFIAGRSAGTTGQKTLLLNNFNKERATNNGMATLNFHALIGNYKLVVFKNDAIVVTAKIAVANEGVSTLYYSFNQFNQGDVVGFVISDDILGVVNPTFKKEYVIFPDNRYSNFIYWENSFLLQSVLECTGSYSLKTDFEYIVQNFYGKLVQHLEIIETKKILKLTIDTGWVLKTDQITIDSLMSSKRVWIKINGVDIALRPTGKSIINTNSEAETISFNLEFQINQTHNEETYSF